MNYMQWRFTGGWGALSVFGVSGVSGGITYLSDLAAL